MDFEYTDKVIAYIDKQLIERYSRLKSLVSFDELNVLQEVNTLYKEVEVLVRKAFLTLANKVYADTLRKRAYRSLEEEWVDNLLSSYDPVSKYIFNHEVDRKCARLIEAIIASDTKAKEIDAALRSMSFMCRIYADRVTDEAVMQAYIDDGDEWVKWVAEKDEKTCKVCHGRDGNIYKIKSVPKDPHPGCRCKRERVSLWEIQKKRPSPRK